MQSLDQPAAAFVLTSHQQIPPNYWSTRRICWKSVYICCEAGRGRRYLNEGWVRTSCAGQRARPVSMGSVQNPEQTLSDSGSCGFTPAVLIL